MYFPLLLSFNPYWLSEYPYLSAIFLIWILTFGEPVKYRIWKGYSLNVDAIISSRRGTERLVILHTPIYLWEPCAKSSIIYSFSLSNFTIFAIISLICSDEFLVYVTFIKFFKYEDYYDEDTTFGKIVIKHNDDAPLLQTSNGKIYYRNFVEDLTLGSQSENVKEWHESKSIPNEVITITDVSYDFEDTELLNKVKLIKQIEKSDFPNNEDTSDSEDNQTKCNKYILYEKTDEKSNDGNYIMKKVDIYNSQKDVITYIQTIHKELTTDNISRALTRKLNGTVKALYLKKYDITPFPILNADFYFSI